MEMMIMVKDDDVASDDAVIDDDDGEHTLQQLHFRECPRYATASQAAWPPLTETATECSHYTINHDEDGNDENGGGWYFNKEGLQISSHRFSLLRSNRHPKSFRGQYMLD